jgi:hypothetical protein
MKIQQKISTRLIFSHCEVWIEVADEGAEEYSQGKLNLISCILHIVSGG